MPSREEIFGAAGRLHAHLLRRHYARGLLRGPDAGVRFNLRAWRFVKSALDFVPWHDDYAFMQTQGYWVLSNWMLFDATGERRFRDAAIETTQATLELQTPEGYWAYPLPERKHLIATVEGDWGAIALLATHAREPREEYRNAALRWYEVLVTRVGFQGHSRGKAVNYFDVPRGKVPNNSVEAAWLFLRLWKATGEQKFLDHVNDLLAFIADIQSPSGELPYVVESPHERRREHYLCFQYHAFQFLKLVWIDALRPGAQSNSILPRLAAFLAKGVRRNGASAYNCSSLRPEIDYFTAVLAAALYDAARLRLVESDALSQRAYARTLARQKSFGGFFYSSGDHGFLLDTRSYPRPQAMTLFHLLYGCGLGDGFPRTVRSPQPTVHS